MKPAKSRVTNKYKGSQVSQDLINKTPQSYKIKFCSHFPYIPRLNYKMLFCGMRA